MSVEDQHPVENSRYRHLKRGTNYTVLGPVRLQTAAHPELDDQMWTLYVAEDGSYSARPPEEFMDGRFAKHVDDPKDVEKAPIVLTISRFGQIAVRYTFEPQGDGSVEMFAKEYVNFMESMALMMYCSETYRTLATERLVETATAIVESKDKGKH